MDVSRLCSSCCVSSEEPNAPTPLAIDKKVEKSTDKGTCRRVCRPITPSPERESISCNHIVTAEDAETPLLLSSSLPETASFSGNDLDDTSDDDSPHTPKEVVFDPFAVGPDRMALAPKRPNACSRLGRDVEGICRRLSFEDDSDDEDPRVVVDNKEELLDVEEMSEEMILECLYESFLETILLKEAEEGAAVLAESECDYPDTSLQTPPCTILGVRDKSSLEYCDEHTCPGAPMKAVVRKAINIEAVRRRLEF